MEIFINRLKFVIEMTVKLYRAPQIYTFVRKDMKGNRISTSGVDSLLVPAYLKTGSSEPDDLKNSLDFELCIWEDDERKLIPGKRIDETNEVKRNLIIYSPRIVRTTLNHRIYEKKPRLSGLVYTEIIPNYNVEPFKDFEYDYITTAEAARIYAKSAGICTEEQFREARNDGVINRFMFDSSSKENYSGKHSSRAMMELFLLKEVNSLS